ncbi:MAG: Gfo/Idh/MocA family oxidoreductase [Anaerolineales bacterium]|nr:Gfo/Idh/MocA family oxidoreductase [Anaerolineales bacterium]
MKFLIIGFGSVGRRHFRNLLELGERDILFYRTNQSTIPDAELSDFQIETDLVTALAQKPDGVIIANPTAFHLDGAIPAAQQGCHILLEKPVSHSMDRVEELSQIAQQTGSKILVGFQFRFHPNLQQIKKLLDDQVIGRTISFRSHWGEYLPSWHPWEDYRESYSARKDLGGGVLLTLSHSMDYLRWLFGEGIVQSSLLGYTGLELDVEDTAEVAIVFGEDIIGSMHLNFTQQPQKHTLEIIGTRGSIYWDYYQNVVDYFRFDGTHEISHDILLSPPDFDRNQLFLDELKHFIQVVKGEINPICDLQDGIKALKLTLDAKTKTQN